VAEVVVKDVIDAPVEAVWEILADFGGVKRWSSIIESCEVEGDGVGAVRTLGLPGGVSLRERLESLDAGRHTYAYSILEPAPLPLKGYLARVSLTDRGGRCAIDWRGSFEPAGVSEEQAAKLVRGVYTGGIAALKKELE
jgi:hypothetical protein